MAKKEGVVTTVRLPMEMRKKIRYLSVDLNLSMGMTAFELIKIGLKEYQRLLPESIPAHQPGDDKPAA